MEYAIVRSDDYLAHHGIKGQKWGVRRFENPDGTLTEAGKVRYAKAQVDAAKYKSAKERFKQVGKAGLAGAVAGGAFGLGAIGERGSASLRNQGLGGSPSIARMIAEGTKSSGYGLDTAAMLAGIGALGSMTVSGIMQGASAIKVKRGQNFVEKYKESYKKTVGGQG